jgi:3'-phosphoadenosine 5'-phosphosulfate sulfotransferase (PAPS reductase)/FAD synthetase
MTDERNAYDIEEPGVVAFSGGRTSGYLLRKVLDAKGGQPDDLVISFQNTGLEHEKTLEFVRDCEERWELDIKWLEYKTEDDGSMGFREVNFETASRKGEPFTDLIKKRQMLPNPIARFCSAELKIRTFRRYIITRDGWEDGWTTAVGLRADEPHRAVRIKGDIAREEVVCPLYLAGVVEKDVLDFWSEQSFDLDLPIVGNMAGNCVGCFLKSRAKIESLMRTMPEEFDWWIKAEELAPSLDKTNTERSKKFRKDRPSYADFMDLTKKQTLLFDPYENDESIPCLCTD